MLTKSQINLIFSLALLLFYTQSVTAAETLKFDKNNYIDGVTLDSIKTLSKTIKTLQAFPYPLTVRVVFDHNKSPAYYQSAIDSLHQYAYIMGEILDSFAFKKYGLNSYKKRVSRYIDHFHSKIAIWEIGNEINGEWLGKTKSVVDKLNAAYNIAKAKKVLIALTFFYNETCSSHPENKMFTWIEKNVTQAMRDGLDFVFISYYPDHCEGPTPPWQEVFHRLHQLFPYAKLGFGELGTEKKAKKAALISEYYRFTLPEPYYIGGNFWWYFRQDMVPPSKPLYAVLKRAVQDRKAAEEAAGKRNNQ